MTPLRLVSLANRYFGYKETVIRIGYAKVDLGKEIKRSCKASIIVEICDRIISFKNGMIEIKSPESNILGKL